MKRISALLTALLLAVALLSGCSKTSDPAAASSEESKPSEAKKEGTFTYIDNENGVTVTMYEGDETNLTVPATLGGKPVTKIADYVRGLSKIESLVLPDSVEVIGKRAFQGCAKLESVTLPQSLKRLEYYAFCNCISLKSITLPDSLLYIGASCFEKCASLTELEIPKGVTSIGSDAFAQCGLKSIRFAEQCRLMVLESGVFASNDITELTLPSNLRKLGDRACADCKQLRTLKLNSGLQHIGEDVVSGSSVGSLTIPASVNELAFQPVRAGDNLKALYFEGDIPQAFFAPVETLDPIPELYIYLHENAKGADYPYAEHFNFRTW